MTKDEQDFCDAAVKLGISIDKASVVFEALGKIGLDGAEAGRILGNALTTLHNKLIRCPNSVSEKHVWSEDWGKNKGKPTTCIFCGILQDDYKKRLKEMGKWA